MTKPLNIGLIGYGFMGRAHSNAYRQVNNFFDLDYQPVLKAVCARNAATRPRRSPRNGATSRSRPTGGSWSRGRISTRSTSASPNNLHHDIAIAAAKAGKMVLCEKPLAMNAAEGARNGRGGREGRRAEHGLVQLPPRAGRHAGQAI